jgi:two-component system chemotaxis response regulator CheY
MVNTLASIMLVDDSQFMRLVLKKTISSTEHRIVAEASNGLEALEMYQQCRPDLTSMGQQMVIVQALQTGAKDFIIKPFHTERLIEAISKTLQNY